MQWLEHVRDSAVRLTSGCSASLVSKDGLILTNHHCVVDCVQTMSTKEHDFVADGYVANTRADEKPCPGMQAEILTDIRDVTPTVLAAMKAADPKDAIKARDAAYAKIGAQNCGTEPLSRCQVISLYEGGQYKLYKYRKYRDVRLVFAPDSRSPSSAATRTISIFHATVSTPASCACTRTTSRQARRLT